MKSSWDKPRSEKIGADSRADVQVEKFKEMIRTTIETSLQETPEGLPGVERHRLAISKLCETIISFFPELKARVVQKEAELIDTLSKDDAVSYEQIPGIMTAFLLANLSFKQIEEVRQQRAEAYGHVALSRILMYEYEGGDVLELHVPTVYTANPLELRKLFLEGLKNLGKRLRTDPGLSGVEMIHARSELIRKGKPLIIRAGFITSEKNSELDHVLDDDEAEISVKDFLTQPYNA